MMTVTKAVVMARGLGSRMRKAADAELTPEQEQAAASGAKAMMPLGGRPFLDHVLTQLADAGITEVCLVIGPEHDAVREYYDGLAKSRIQVSYAVQVEPKGTADAVAAAADFAGQDRFVVINGDNLYPTDSLRRLITEPGLGVVGFEPDSLVSNSNIPADRIAAFALLRSDDSGGLADIIEKPTAADAERMGPNRLVNMNCWLLGPQVFQACAEIELSPRGELELPDAVRWLINAGVRIAVVASREGVLDLSSRDDIADVTTLVSKQEVNL